MKNIKLCALATVALAASAMLTGCKLDGNDMTQYFSVSLCNLIIPTDPSQPVTATSGSSYKVNYNFTQGKVTVSAEDVVIGDKTLNLTSDEMSFTERMNSAGYVRDFKGDGKLSDGTLVSDLEGFESTLFYYLPTAVPGVVGVTPIDNRVVFSYNVGFEYQVKTFPQDIYFGGETVTHYSIPGQDGKSFSNKESVYRVYFNKDLKTATVVIYNVRFAEEMPRPLKAVALVDLKVTFGRNGYTVSGENIIPKMMEGDGVTDYPERTFTSFTLTSAGAKLTDCVCDYTVLNVFKGHFEGSYVAY